MLLAASLALTLTFFGVLVYPSTLVVIVWQITFWACLIAWLHKWWRGM